MHTGRGWGYRERPGRSTEFMLNKHSQKEEGRGPHSQDLLAGDRLTVFPGPAGLYHLPPVRNATVRKGQQFKVMFGYLTSEREASQ